MTLSVTVAPLVTVCDRGCVVIVGTAAVLTAIVAVELFALPAVFVTWTQKLVVVVNGGVVKLLEFAPTGVPVVPLVP